MFMGTPLNAWKPVLMPVRVEPKPGVWKVQFELRLMSIKPLACTYGSTVSCVLEDCAPPKFANQSPLPKIIIRIIRCMDAICAGLPDCASLRYDIFAPKFFE